MSFNILPPEGNISTAGADGPEKTQKKKSVRASLALRRD